MNTKKTIKQGLNELNLKIKSISDVKKKKDMQNQLFIFEQIAMNMFKSMKDISKLNVQIESLPKNHLFSDYKMFIDGREAVDNFISKLKPYL